LRRDHPDVPAYRALLGEDLWAVAWLRRDDPRRALALFEEGRVLWEGLLRERRPAAVDRWYSWSALHDWWTQQLVCRRDDNRVRARRDGRGQEQPGAGHQRDRAGTRARLAQVLRPPDRAVSDRP